VYHTRETKRRLSKTARAGEWGGSNLVWRNYEESSFKSTLRLMLQRGGGAHCSAAVLPAKQLGSALALPLPVYNYTEILVKNSPILDSTTDRTTGRCYEIVKCVFTLVAFLYRSPAAFRMYTQ